MYSTLDVYGFSPTTTNQHFPCPSLGLPTYHPTIAKKREVAVDATIHIASSSWKDDDSIKEDRGTYASTSEAMSGKTLLPVMNPAFNLREICKQCILLEDHLSHDQKRCKDCCTKHFLALEALAEEAVTLDADGKFQSIVQHLPERIRELEIQWMKDPKRHSRRISQALREIRKAFQEQCFDVIQYECNDGACHVSAT